MFKSDYFLILKRLGFAFCFYPFVRIFFYFFNLDYFNDASFIELLGAFLYGLRFDFSTVLIINAVFIITSLIPLRFKLYKRLLKIIFVVSNFVAIAINIGDFEFFKFNGKRLTKDILDMGTDEILGQVVQLTFYYWYLGLLSLITLVTLYKFYPSSKNTIEYRKKIYLFLTPLIGVTAIAITFIGIRGGLQMRSISPKEAFIFQRYELGNLAINSTYTLIRSLDKKGLEKKNFFISTEVAIDNIKKNRNLNNTYQGKANQNIVIIIMESFSQEYIDNGYTPFFSDLSKKGLYFNQGFANGRRSIEVLPSILAGMPSVIGRPIYQSQYQTNKFIGLPQVLKKNGYDVSFFHGGKRGTMDFDAYTKSIGIDKYYAMEDYPDTKHFDGNWGIYDHHFFSFMEKEISDFKKPFFTTFFSLSSHQPYSIPSNMEGKFSKGTLEIHESIGYADDSLKTFFESIKGKDWFQNTLFVITGDHTQKLNTKAFMNRLGQYRVPILYYHPSMDLSFIDSERTTQHADIFPSIVDFTNIKLKEKLIYGTSVFSKDSGSSLNFINGQYLYFKKPFLLSLIGEKVTFTEYDNDLVIESNIIQPAVGAQMLLELKSYIQYTNNGLKENNLYTD